MSSGFAGRGLGATTFGAGGTGGGGGGKTEDEAFSITEALAVTC